MWQDGLSHIWLDTAGNFYINYSINGTQQTFDIYTYTSKGTGTVGNTTWTSKANGQTYTLATVTWNDSTRYLFQYYFSSNTGSLNTYQNRTFTMKELQMYQVSDMYVEFKKMILGQNSDITGLLTSINNYLDSIDDINADILSELQILSSSLSTIETNTSTDYSQQIGGIANKIDDILDDNQTIISQNEDMITQQEQINENLEEVNDSVQELKDTITDDTVESGASDLPSTSVNDPTQTGIDNIFNSIYNAFCIGQAQDIVFPIPFTETTITLSPYYVRDMLNDNGAGWVYTLIQAFWGYLIGRFIVYDVMKKISKIKSGNIEELETDNIKGDML